MTQNAVSNNEITFSEGFLKEFEPFLQKRLTIKSLKQFQISPKNVHDWQRRGLKFGFRENKDSGWLRFKWSDVILLKIFFDCKSQGISFETVRDASEKIFNARIRVSIFCKENESVRQASLPLLDYGILACMKGHKMLLSIDNEEAMAVKPDSINQSFKIKGVKNPTTITILPLYKYVQEAVSVITKNDSQLKALRKSIESSKSKIQ